mmetsp:Transcript_7749/g.25732  ORF Transcript_7749/g.25732 Transcript_7749/m.25732 type:complete len:235 (-) Transcript_7749:198-902(-)
MRSRSVPCSMTRTERSFITCARSLTDSMIFTISRSRSATKSSLSCTRCICESVNPGSPPSSSNEKPTSSNDASAPPLPPPAPPPSCWCCSFCRYSFCILRNSIESFCSDVAALICTFFRTLISCPPPVPPVSCRTASSHRLNRRVISCVSTSMCGVSSATSSKVTSSERSWCRLSSAILIRICSIPVCTRSLASTHPGGMPPAAPIEKLASSTSPPPSAAFRSPSAPVLCPLLP